MARTRCASAARHGSGRGGAPRLSFTTALALLGALGLPAAAARSQPTAAPELRDLRAISPTADASSEREDRGLAIERLEGGGHVLVGSTTARAAGAPPDGRSRALILTTDATGGASWSDIREGRGRSEFRDLALATAEGLVVAAGVEQIVEGEILTGTQTLVASYTLDGERRWTLRHTTSRRDEARSVDRASDGGWLVFGTSLLKLDASGGKAWENVLVRGFAVRSTPDGGCVTLGIIERAEFARDGLVTRFDREGEVLWDERVGTERGEGSPARVDTPVTIRRTHGGGWVIVGASERPSSTVVFSSWLSDGGVASGHAQLSLLGVATVGGLALLPSDAVVASGSHSVGGAGAERSVPFLTRLEATGAVGWERDYTDARFADMRLIDLEPAADGGFVATGEAGAAEAADATEIVLASFSRERVPFLRGDSDSGGALEITDALRTLRYLFLDGDLPCLDAADADDNGRVDITDAVVTLSHLFLGRAPPPPPTAACGFDPTDDALDCAAPPRCPAEARE